jgi:hypothetical protein
MQKLHYSIHINAPKEKVWDTMLQNTTYREWTKPFNPGSTYIGEWDQGSEIRFVGTNEKGDLLEGGMYSRIKENRLHEYISIEHLGIILPDGTVDTTSDAVKKWVPSFENYTFTENNGGTDVIVDIDMSDEFKEEFDKMWPQALRILKELAEK